MPQAREANLRFEAKIAGIKGLRIIHGRDTEPGEGPYNMFSAGVHGDEAPGIEAARRLLPYMEGRLEQGTVIFTWGNLDAMARGKRQVDQNLNRMFQDAADLSPEARESREYARAQELKVPLEEGTPVEALLDLHGTSNSETTPHVITEPKGYELASHLPVDIVVAGFDKFEPGGIDYYANTQEKIGICVEPGYNGDPDAIEIAYQSALAFLVAQEHVSGEVARRIQRHWRLFYVAHTNVRYVPVQPTLPDFTSVAQGQLLGHDGAQEVRVPNGPETSEEAIILFGAKERKPGVEAFLLAKREDV